MEINKISNDTKKSMLTRVITGIIMALVILPCVILGDWFFIALVFIVVGVGIFEFVRATGKKYPWYLIVLIYIFTYSFVFWVFFQKGNSYTEPIFELVNGNIIMYDVRISTMGVGFLIAILFLSSIISQKTDINDIFYLFTMSLFIGFAGQSLLFLRFAPDGISNFNYLNQFQTSLLIFFVVAGALLNDICAYFVGVLFGKHKLAPIISPKKTWEGFIGGLVLSSILVTLFAILCDEVFNTPILKGIIDTEHWFFVSIVSFGIGLASVLGDLMFSSIKRAFNIKDFGKIFPGHGGVLDRFDSVLMVAILAAIMITFIHYNPLFGAITQ